MVYMRDGGIGRGRDRKEELLLTLSWALRDNG